jgi:replication factor A2
MFAGQEDAFVGNGFMPSQHAGASAEKRNSNYENKNTLRAVTLRQLKAAIESTTDDRVMLDGKPIDNISIVGKVIATELKELTFNLTIDDGTGVAKVLYYISHDDEFERERRAQWHKDIYVRITGHVQNTLSGGKNAQLVAYDVRPIADHNMVTFHFLQSIFQSAHLTSNGPGTGIAADEGVNTAAVAAAPGGGAYTSAAPAAGYNSGGLNPVESEILAFFSADDPNNEIGLSIEQVRARLGGRMSDMQVRQVVSKLSDDGHLYTTTDDDHYKCVC